MIIIKVNGGLGNQLFQYALYLWCNQNIDQTVMLDIHEYSIKSIHSGFDLPSILLESENLNIVQDESCEEFHNYHTLKRVLLKLTGHYESHYFEHYFKDTKELFSFLDSNCKVAYLEGYWQTVDIIRPIKNRLKSNIVRASKLPLSFNNWNTLTKITETESVSLHVRCGDYISTETNRQLYGGICTEAYYKSAMDYIVNSLPNEPTFFVFSDDIERAKQIVAENQSHKIIYVEENNSDAFIDILLMRECKHHIIANSSFSWWGAVLSTKRGMFIMPQKWNNQLSENLLVFPENVLIDEKGNVV